MVLAGGAQVLGAWASTMNPGYWVCTPSTQLEAGETIFQKLRTVHRVEKERRSITSALLFFPAAPLGPASAAARLPTSLDICALLLPYID